VPVQINLNWVFATSLLPNRRRRQNERKSVPLESPQTAQTSSTIASKRKIETSQAAGHFCNSFLKKNLNFHCERNQQCKDKRQPKPPDVNRENKEWQNSN
jgi:hypothetical protein